MDLDLRKLRYFAAVAEHGHFGRAAEQLYIAQPVLSRQVRALEHDLGCNLFERTTRSVQLTAAGKSLQEERRDEFPRRRCSRAASPRGRPGRRAGGRRLRTRSPGLRGRANVFARSSRRRDRATPPALVGTRRPTPGWPGRRWVPPTSLSMTPGSEPSESGANPRSPAFPSSHKLAGQSSLRLVDLEGESIIDPTRRRISSVEEKFELVAAGHGIAVVPPQRRHVLFAARPHLPPGDRRRSPRDLPRRHDRPPRSASRRLLDRRCGDAQRQASQTRRRRRTPSPFHTQVRTPEMRKPRRGVARTDHLRVRRPTAQSPSPRSSAPRSGQHCIERHL